MFQNHLSFILINLKNLHIIVLNIFSYKSTLNKKENSNLGQNVWISLKVREASSQIPSFIRCTNFSAFSEISPRKEQDREKERSTINLQSPKGFSYPR